MDRAYKAEDTVHVHQSDRDGKLLDTFEQRPYSNAGFDSYRYKNDTYPGYELDGYVYILLDRPMK